MAIIRVSKQPNQFSIVDRTAAEDERLSFKAKGIMFYLLTKPDNWNMNVRDLINHSKDGRDSVYAGIDELKQLGYVEFKKFKNEKGHFITEYIVYEHPQKPLTENPEPEKKDDPLTENPNAVKSEPENTEHSNNDLNDIEFKKRKKERKGINSDSENISKTLKTLKTHLINCWVNDYTEASDFVKEIYVRAVKDKLDLSDQHIKAAAEEWKMRNFNYLTKTDRNYDVKLPDIYFVDCFKAAIQNRQAENMLVTV